MRDREYDPFRPFECECDTRDAFVAAIEGRPAHLCPVHQPAEIAQRARDDQQRQAYEQAARLRMIADEMYDIHHGTPAPPACSCGPVAGLTAALQTGESPACPVHRPDTADVALPALLPAALHDAFSTPPTDPTAGDPAAA